VTAHSRGWSNARIDRGWYAGPVGWVDAKGDGEFRVALRSGLLQGGEARLYAGAGIVAGSRPEQELAETRLKLRALLAPLTEI
jgi:isochorismate synthase EntC